MSEDKLRPLREQIDHIDGQLIELLNQRALVAEQVGHVKAATAAPVFRPEREAQVLRAVAERNPGPLHSADLQIIFREIMSACRALEKRICVAFLGPVGTYSELAVIRHFGQAVEALPCASIDDVFRATESGSADFGVVPIENSSEGVINRTLDLLLQTSLVISGELALPVRHNLLTSTGNMDNVTRICAHPQALAQCHGWLSQHYPDLPREAMTSNGEAARLAATDASIGAIASEHAATRYGLGVAESNIQDDPHNRTRFAVIGRLQTGSSGSDQTSLVLSVKNEPGAVYRLLAPLAQHGVSMTRFESRPARSGTWEYFFFVDVEGHASDAKVAAALAALAQQAAFFKLLGSYPV